MTPTEIKARMEIIRELSSSLLAEVKTLQDQCPHPEFGRGLTIIACVQEIDICTTCGFGKPIDFSGEGFAVHTSIN